MRGEYSEAFEFGKWVLVVLVSNAVLSESREVTLARRRIERMLGGEINSRFGEEIHQYMRGGYAGIGNMARDASVDKLPDAQEPYAWVV